MAINLDKLKLDPTKASEGVWVVLDDTDEDECAVLMASVTRSTPTFQRAHRRAMEQAKRRKRRRLNDTEIDEIFLDCLCEHAIYDWRGFEEGGETLKFSPETAKRVVREYPEIGGMILEEVMNLDNYRAAQDEEMAGNSPRPPPGS